MWNLRITAAKSALLSGQFFEIARALFRAHPIRSHDDAERVALTGPLPGDLLFGLLIRCTKTHVAADDGTKNRELRGFQCGCANEKMSSKHEQPDTRLCWTDSVYVGSLGNPLAERGALGYGQRLQEIRASISLLRAMAIDRRRAAHVEVELAQVRFARGNAVRTVKYAIRLVGCSSGRIVRIGERRHRADGIGLRRHGLRRVNDPRFARGSCTGAIRG